MKSKGADSVARNASARRLGGQASLDRIGVGNVQAEKSSTLPTGVRKTSTGRFCANRMTRGKLWYLGTFNTVDEAQQAYRENQRTLVRKKAGLPRGVRCAGKKFTAQIRAGGVRKYLGTFKTAEDAAAAYQSALSVLKPQDGPSIVG